MSRILEKLADQHEERIINVLYKLEEDIVKEVTRATKGQLVSQRLAIQLQPQIRKLVADNYLNEADIIINEEYNKIAKEVLDTFGEMPIPKKFKSLTQVDLQTINALKTQSFSGFEDIAERFSKVINDEIYQSTIAGRPFEDMVSNIKSHINGVYKTSNTREINELVDFINENKFDSTKKAQVEDAVRKLHTQYASDRAGNNLRRYASQIAHDSVMQFHGQFTVAKAKEAGLTHFTYTGTLVRDSRPFCIDMLNKTLTEEQIRDMWNNRSWQGKSTGDPFIVRGGYRCRHTWIPTDPAWGEETVDEVPDEPEEEEAPPPPTPPPVIDERDIFTPINREGVTEQTIQILSAKEATTRLNKVFSDASKDDRYLNKKINHYRGSRVENFGKVSGSKLDENGLSMLVAMMPEAEALCKKFNVPMIRGIKGSKNERSYLANMGDGVMGMQVQFAKQTSKNIGDITVTQARNKKINEEMDKLLKQSTELAIKIDNIYKSRGVATFTEFRRSDVTIAELREVSELLKKKNTIIDKYNELESLSTTSLHTELSVWKRGDNLKSRPWSAKAFEDNNVDQFRATFYHEIGHHIHQQYKIKDTRSADIKKITKEPAWFQANRPLEDRLNKVKGIKEHSPSNYGATNTKEWFVENFSLYYRGKEELVAPEFLKILQEIKDDKIP